MRDAKGREKIAVVSGLGEFGRGRTRVCVSASFGRRGEDRQKKHVPPLQARARSRTHRHRVPAVDEAIGIHVGAEVGRIGRLTGAIARLLSIAGINKAIAIRVADEHTHLHVNVAPICAVAKVEQGDCDSLRVGYTSKVDREVLVPLPLVLLTDPPAAVTAALLKLTALGKVKTTW